MRRRTTILAGLAVGLAIAAYLLTAPPPGPRSMRQFEPDRLAKLELEMWQAYYAKENVRLFRLLVMMLREQYHYSWAVAAREAFHLARAAATFGNARQDYERVLPDIETAYATAREWLGAGFDPPAVARAELAWWVARRTPGHDSADQVGDLIADEYAMLYEVPRPRVVKAALMRAQAAALRDAQAAQPDWATIGTMLDGSYTDLREAVSPR